MPHKLIDFRFSSIVVEFTLYFSGVAGSIPDNDLSLSQVVCPL